MVIESIDLEVGRLVCFEDGGFCKCYLGLRGHQKPFPEYRRFADAISQYYKSWREIVDTIRESGEIDHVVNLFLLYLAFLASESVSLTRMELHGETILNEEFIGIRLFPHPLSRYVRSKHAEELSKAMEN
ncbi:MAG: hypothetical protein QW794_05325 [Thermosphaera sp.]